MKYLLIISEVPADWKLVSIVPIFKTGFKEDPINYRPVSLTSVSDKVVEKIILGGVEKHLKDNSQLSQPLWLHERKVSKAFDIVSHRILPDKMSSTQLDKHIVRWVSSWLMDWAKIYSGHSL